MSTPAEVGAMAASSVLGAPGEDQGRQRTSRRPDVALGPVSGSRVQSQAAAGNQWRDGGYRDDPRRRSSANITHDVQVFQVVGGGWRRC